MIINKQVWFYKLYAGTYTVFGNQVPWNTNLCQFVRRTFFLSWFWYLLAGLMHLFFFGVLTPLAFLIGKVPCRSYSYGQWSPGWGFRNYAGIRLGEFELFPWMVVAPTSFFGLNALCIRAVYRYGSAATFPCVFLVIEFIFLCVAAYFLFFEGMFDETKSVTGAWFSAKKQKICPLIEFSDELPTDREP